jgi:hypothetical protein
MTGVEDKRTPDDENSFPGKAVAAVGPDPMHNAGNLIPARMQWRMEVGASAGGIEKNSDNLKELRILHSTLVALIVPCNAYQSSSPRLSNQSANLCESG